MNETPKLSIYEKTFAKSHKTDAILVVDGKKLHVNKAILSYHSDYFNALFNSEFKEKSMEEIEIKDVNFEDFATVLSLFDEKPLEITKENAENLLQLADRFLLNNAKIHVEFFMKNSTEFRRHKQKMLGEENKKKSGQRLFPEANTCIFRPPEENPTEFRRRNRLRMLDDELTSRLDGKKLEENRNRNKSDQRLFPESLFSDAILHSEHDSTEFRCRHKQTILGDEILNITDDRLSLYGSEKLEKNRNRNISSQRLFPESVTSDLFPPSDNYSTEFRRRREKLAEENKKKSGQRLFPDSFFSDDNPYIFRPPENNSTEFRDRHKHGDEILNITDDRLSFYGSEKLEKNRNRNISNQRLFPESVISDLFRHPAENSTEFRRRNRLRMLEEELINSLDEKKIGEE